MSALPEFESLARAAGFDLYGTASLASPPPSLQQLDPWLAKGYHGSMAWLERQRDKRLDPGLVLEGARSVLCVGLVYNTAHPYSTEAPGQPWISRYAWGDDYHAVMDAKLEALEAALRRAHPGAKFRRYSDTGPVAEKAWAVAAGLGWVGKHTNLINQKAGSWFFLGEILTDLDLAPAQPAPDLCGSCTQCLDACPTAAFPAPGVLDATRCISYLTIEHKGEIPAEFHAAIGMNLYGCDICQDVCPWNHWKVTGTEPAFQPRPENLPPDPAALAEITDEAFSARFKNSPVKRAKAAGIRRNARIVLKNQKR